jgi:hypothetical protein
VSGEVIPPNAVMYIGEMNSDGFYEVNKPVTDSHPYGVMFNDMTPIPVDGIGQCTADLPNWVRFDDSESGSGNGSGSISPGSSCGPRAGEWGLFSSETGFRSLSELDEDRLIINVILDPAVSDPDSGSGSGSGDDCETEVTFQECDPDTGERTNVTITFPNCVTVTRTPVSSSGG